MIYDIKAIPTTYAGVNFRSRHEARWAAFLDLVGIKWDYEPFDLDGWAPDFLLRTQGGAILAEVKPFDFEQPVTMEMCRELAKAARHAKQHNVLLLGIAPLTDTSIGISLTDCPLVPAVGSTSLWRQAGNAVQWMPDEDPAEDYYTQLRRIFGRRAA